MCRTAQSFFFDDGCLSAAQRKAVVSIIEMAARPALLSIASGPICGLTACAMQDVFVESFGTCLGERRGWAAGARTKRATKRCSARTQRRRRSSRTPDCPRRPAIPIRSASAPKRARKLPAHAIPASWGVQPSGRGQNLHRALPCAAGVRSNCATRSRLFGSPCGQITPSQRLIDDCVIRGVQKPFMRTIFW